MCGIFGIYSAKENVSDTIYLGLYALQHRGQEGAGIAVSDGKQIRTYKRLGILSEIFTKDIINNLKGNIGIGHTRYSTTGSYNEVNTQPLVSQADNNFIAVAHNGNLTNSLELRTQLQRNGAQFQTTMDTEIFVHILKNNYKGSFESLLPLLTGINGSYSLVIIINNKLYGLRDRFGFKPLLLGRKGSDIILCSETCALDYVGARFVREVEPGEVIEIEKGNIKSCFLPKDNVELAQCIFEFVYFARPDSFIFGRSVNDIRIEFGRQLARESWVDADVVIDIPDSGTSAALGYSEESKIPYQRGFVRNHFIGRTFIAPFQASRETNLRLKLNPIRSVIYNKRVVVVDDSIVRGNTAKFRVSQLKDAGAKEVHYRIASPPIKFPCFFGIDFPTREELIAYNLSIPQIEKEINVNSLRYLSIEGMLKVVGSEKRYCYACFSGKYKVSPPPSFRKEILES